MFTFSQIYKKSYNIFWRWIKFLFKTQNMENKVIGEKSKQESLFSQSLQLMLNPKQKLFIIANSIDWHLFEARFKKYYSKTGRPSKPIRLMSALILLKEIFGISDEKIVTEWSENPYYQYFSGEEVFQWGLPCTASEITSFRQRIGEEGIDLILSQLPQE